ncbi:MAG: (2Fe-2S)-binding protein [Deltaproteobacteria bacterium]|nr:(2Fe-2S)-binding protein [Deltaproteobacteria bacterium]
MEGQTIRAFTSESVAAALVASGERVLSRSLKYHRPRTFFCMEGHCGGCLARIDGVPNLRACQTPCTTGTTIEGQNAYPSPEIDLFGAVDFLFPRGMDHHTLMTGSSILNNLASKVVRQLSGLGKLPATESHELPAVQLERVDVCVIGGGPAGLAAATAAASSGASTLLVDDQLRLGGSLLADPRLGVAVADARVAAAMAAGVRALPRSTAIAFFPEDAPEDGGVLAVATPDHLVRVVARRWVWATGGYAVNLLFADNDRPGVLAARGVGRMLVQHGIAAGERICVVVGKGMDDYANALAEALRGARVDVTTTSADQVERARGRSWVTAVELTSRRRLDCDVVAVAAMPAPASEGPRQQGCRTVLDPARGGFRVIVDRDGRTSTPDVFACGDVCGYVGPMAAATVGARVGGAAAEEALALARELGPIATTAARRGA